MKSYWINSPWFGFLLRSLPHRSLLTLTWHLIVYSCASFLQTLLEYLQLDLVFFFLFLRVIIFILCVLCFTSMSVCAPFEFLRPAEGTGSPGAGLISRYYQPCVCCEWSPGPLQEQVVLLSAEPSSEPLALCSSTNRQLPEVDAEISSCFSQELQC